ncbi:MAG: ABC transporter substrate-binding protein [Actinomycetes bacterium]
MGRRTLSAAVGMAAVGLVLAACGGSSDSGGGGGTTSALFRMGSGSTIDSLNPFVAFNQLAYNTFFYNYPSMVQYNKDLDFAPYMADSWTTSADGKTWTFKIHPDAKWSDGETLDATDVAWTYSTLIKYKKGGAANWAGTIAYLKSVKATDPTTAVFTYSTPVANVLSQLAQVPILPEQFWGQYATGKDGADLKSAKIAPSSDNPMIAGGPFQVVGYTPKDVIQFKTNADYFGTMPKIPGFAVKMYTNDDAMVTALKNGEIDFIDGLPSEQVDAMTQAGFQVANVSGVEWHDLIINSSPNKTTHPELANLKVREAMEYALNRQAFIDTIWPNAAEPGAAIVPPATNSPTTPWSDTSIQPLPNDPAKANQILDGLGFKAGSDGIRVANGVRMSYQMIVPSSMSKSSRVFDLFQQQFKGVGIELSLKLLDDSAAFDAITAPDNTYANFDLAYWDWVPLIDPDFILSVLTCDQYGGWSDTGYCDPKYDALYAKQASQIDPAARVDTVHQMQQMIHEARPYVVLAYNNALNATAPGWSGLEDSPQGQFNNLSTDSLVNVHQ